MDNFPLICRQDPLDVRVSFILKHYEITGETIRMEDVPKAMIGGVLHVASKNKTKLTRELLDQKLLLLEYKTSIDAKLEEAKIREEI